MTPLQKRRHSTMRQGKRRATQRIILPSLISCTNCHQPIRSHRVCPYCGFYSGRKVKT
ncbi:50S ribosomal protein L32 [Candidatus Amesbacteria bacterium RIFCSPHIGHO2_02_FULL_48_21]|nr:MAG: 50S ribosomal protein L32 [Candidatus Amesbacteria bacterium RIFCSPHIGHO2_02_FULL_48_21]